MMSSRTSRTIHTDFTDEDGEYGTAPPNPLKRSDPTEDQIASLQSAQDSITGELEYLRMKLQEKQRKLEGLNSRQQQTRPVMK